MAEEPKDLTTRVLVEIRDELRGHTRILSDHEGRLGGVENAVVRLIAAVDTQSITLRQILHAVETGNERRDVGLQDHERRIARLESHIGLDR